jgi:hypothetical protein
MTWLDSALWLVGKVADLTLGQSLEHDASFPSLLHHHACEYFALVYLDTACWCTYLPLVLKSHDLT